MSAVPTADHQMSLKARLNLKHSKLHELNITQNSIHLPQRKNPPLYYNNDSAVLKRIHAEIT